MASFGYDAVVLAGGDDKRLFPLCAGAAKALLPVGNKPLLHYPLRTLSEAGLRHVFVIVSGEKPAASISAWIQSEYPAQGPGLQCEVVTVPEEYGTADALRAVASKITSSTFVVMSGDLLTDVPVNALVASHQMHGALATVMLCPRKISPASETKPGKPPKNVDYIGLDTRREQLLFYASSPEALRDLKVPHSIIKRHGTVHISSNLVDAHLYVFNRSLLTTLESQSKLVSLRQDLLPFLTQHHVRLRPPLDSQASLPSALSPGVGMRQHSSGASEGENGSEADFQIASTLPGSNYMDMTHGRADLGMGGALTVSASGLLRVHVVQQDSNYCARIDDLQAYGDVNREVADPNLALHLSGLRPSKYDNIVAASTTLGNKTTVAAACIVGDNGVIGDKSSIKRSVLGNGVKLGTNVKVINSVLMDNVSVADNCTVQNSILCSGVQLKERATVKDCQIGPGFVVAGGLEYKGEVLARGAK